MFGFFHGEIFWTLYFLSLIRTGNQVGPMGRTQACIAILQLFSHGQTVHEAPRHLRAEGPSTWGSLFLLLGFWGLWIPPCRFSPTLGSRHSGGSCFLISAHSVSWLGFWTGPWCQFLPLHIYYYPASPPSLHPVLCVFHKLVHEPHQLLLCDGLTSQFLLQFRAAAFKSFEGPSARHVHHSA